jgi:hypothetical protein
MLKVINDGEFSNGTSRQGDIQVKYKDLVLAFGEPMESDGYKVSGEWVFLNEETGDVFTLYDWKSTSLYNHSLPSVETFRNRDIAMQFNIGGHGSSNLESFKRFLLRQIEYAKLDKPFEEIVLKSETK